ncbi:MAG: hypothetical protein J6C11_06840 [Spirochaetaceae bacterium]|nr:hypothetical protein [Spirochaetaceae bacterium]
MSTCPEHDMHSVYLDGELPQKYALEYESHMTTCQQCRDKYMKLQGISALLKEDADRHRLSSQEMEDSFARLQTKLRYQKTVREIQPKNINRFTWVVPTVAAAALAFALILPARHGISSPAATTSSERPISISANALTGGLVSAPSVNHQRSRFLSDSAIIMEEPISQHLKTVSFASDNAISTMDIFRPSFETEKNISVKMTLSDLNSIPVQGEISVPIQMFITISGN